MRNLHLLAPLGGALLALALAGCPSDEPKCGDGTTEGEALCGALCGNGTIDPGEECDDGNTTDGDGCTADCRMGVVQVCGNGVTEGTEQCDDANQISSDGCENDCTTTVAVCGNGTREGDELCDDGNQTAGDGCENDCTPTPAGICGDATVDPGEECDDGNTTSFDGCENDCTETTVVFEQCPGATLPPPSGGPCDIITGDAARLITGDVLVPGTVYVGGQVLFDAAGVIQCVGCDCTQVSGAATATQVSCPGSVVSPGLINPHDHITYYAAPYVNTSGERYEHRHDWRRGNDGHTEVSSGPNSTANGAPQVQWNELRQVMAGTTSVAGSGGIAGLLRNLDRSNGLEGISGAYADYDTFPLGDSNGLELVNSCAYGNIANAGQPNNGVWLPHVAEGIEASARNEFLCLTGVGEGSKEAIASRTSVIHGIGLRAADVGRMALTEASLIWSPRSNIFLYGDTAPVRLYKRFGVNIALGTDWVRSGSKSTLRELKCADYLNQTHYGHTFRDDELWLMVTLNAAKALGFEGQVGSLEVGKRADISIFRGASESPYRSIIEAQSEDVLLTLRGGKVLFGDQVVVTALTADACDAVDVCGTQKAVCLQTEIGKTFAALSGENSSTYPLFFCGEPMNEPTCVPFRSAMAPSPSTATAYTGAVTEDDWDGDGIPNAQDNCPNTFNPVRPVDNGAQADGDGDGVGDVCDVCPLDAHTTTCSEIVAGDSDLDGVPDNLDNCPTEPNPDQADTDMDGIGDVCDGCPVPNPGNSACPTTIYEVKKGTFNGQAVSLGGVQVTAVKAGTGFFVQIPTASATDGVDFSGLYVYAPQQSAAVARGDIVTVEGTPANYFGQIQLTNVGTPVVQSSGNPEIAPVAVTSAEVATNGARAAGLEGVLVRVENVTVTELEPAPAGNETAPTWEYVVDGTLRINDFLYRTEPFPVVGEEFGAITGVLNFQRENSKVEPRDANDIIGGAATVATFGPEGQFIREGQSGNTFPEAIEVTLSRAQATDTVVTVTSGSADLTVGNGGVVTIPAGQTSAVVPVTGVAQNASVTLTATLGTSTATTTVRVLGLNEAASLVSLTSESPAVPPGTSVTLTVALDLPAPSNTVVSLDLDPSAFGTLPADVTVLQDEMTATFTLTADANATGSADVTATLGTDSQSVTLVSALLCMPSRVVISQVYGGGGATSGSPSYTHDYVELHNRSAQPVDITGWSLQYGSASGTGNWNVAVITPEPTASTILQPGQYYLVRQGGGSVGGALTAHDATGGLNMSASNGKVALVSDSTALNGANPTGATVVDKVGFGSANGFETAATQALSNTTAAIRKDNGCTDTDDNSADFDVATPTPRNSATAAVSCGCN